MWLLLASQLKAIEDARLAGFAPTAIQQEQLDARIDAIATGNTSRILKTAGNIAEISIQGVLTKAPDFFAAFFGGGNTTYAELIGAVAAAEQDPAVTDIRFAVDSPGGQIDDLFEAVAAIQNTTKPTTAVVSNLAASAAYALVAATDRIEATNTAARFGSVGIVQGFYKSSNIIEVTSSNAPNKRPDVTTEEGKAVVRADLDGIEDLFIDAIATGRGTTTEKVSADFGRGGTMLATEAIERGMIDGLVGQATTTPAITGGILKESAKMDLHELKASHPDVYAAAVNIGTTEERDRVEAHLTMGQASGDMKTAMAAVEDGSGMTAKLQAAYMSAGMNRADTDLRGEDTEAADAAAGKVAADAEVDQGNEVLALVQASMGIEGDA